MCVKRRLVILCFLLIGCRLSDFTGLTSSKSENGIPSSQKAQIVWKNYLDSIEVDKALDEGIQKQCEPRVFPSKTSETKGVIMLFHGYTACPQQFFEWAERLNNLSWEVVVPLHPGHGYKKLENGDNMKYLPDSTNFKKKYGDFVTSMNELMKAYPENLKKQVAGLSLGGAMAAQAISSDPNLYEQALILTPAFEYSNWKARYVSRILFSLRNWKWITRTDKYKELMNSMQGWGEPCERERQLGRAGICDFLAKHAIAMNQFGKHVASQIHSDIKTVVQFVIVDEDPAVKNSAILKVFKRLRARKEGERVTSICAMPKNSNHSLISRFDNPDLEKWWLNDLLQALDRFVEDGEFITADNRKLYAGVPACKIENHTLGK